MCFIALLWRSGCHLCNCPTLGGMFGSIQTLDKIPAAFRAHSRNLTRDLIICPACMLSGWLHRRSQLWLSIGRGGGSRFVRRRHIQEPPDGGRRWGPLRRIVDASGGLVSDNIALEIRSSILLIRRVRVCRDHAWAQEYMRPPRSERIALPSED